jgi:hypothetical protein
MHFSPPYACYTPAHLVSVDFISVVTLRDEQGTTFVAPY